MDKQVLQVGEIVQLSPETCRNRMLAGCMMTVTEPKSFGAQGYVQVCGSGGEPGGQAYYRANWEEMEPTGGQSPFVVNWLTAEKPDTKGGE